LSRTEADRSRERRAKRICARRNLHLMAPLKPDKKVLAHGGYMLRDGATMRILLGDRDYLFSASMDEVEAYLDGLA
jgi:hypothetical protein